MHEVFKTIIKELKKNVESDLRIYGGRCNGKTLLVGYMKGMEDAITIVKKLSGRYNNGWIPCSERLPEETDYPEQRYRILASCSDGIVRNATIKSLRNPEEKHHCMGNEFTYVAWQPLPEPYKKGESNAKSST